MRFLLVLAMLFTPLFCGAQVKIEKPTSKQATSFAIVIDDVTMSKTSKAVYDYRDALERDGLSVYIVSGKFARPEEVKDQLIAINAHKPALEGVVFIGDIPVVLVRNGQHMTTAFKMDEDGFPWDQSSVTSDRFYDDLHLTFTFIKQDANNPRHFYYKLNDDSPQDLKPTFYSGRIMYPAELGGDKYAEIEKYLKKVVRERAANDMLDHLVVYNGNGYNSDCLTAWIDGKYAVNEHFPFTIKDSKSQKHLNFRMGTPNMKFYIFDELQRPEVDVFLFNEHGSPDKQHIDGGEPVSTVEARLEWIKSYVFSFLDRENRKKDADFEGAKAYFKELYGLDDSFFADFGTKERKTRDSLNYMNTNINLPDLPNVNIQPRFVMFNACYNGSFNRDGNIAGYYIFNQGRTVATQGNTVNVLQDRWTYEMLGMISHGVRIGQYNRQIATLEGHIIGDPAFRFASVWKNNISAEIVSEAGNTKLWEQYLHSEYADVRSIALRMLADNDNNMTLSPFLLQTMKECKFATTRMECLKLLGRYRNADFIEAIKLGLNDSYELTRRNAANYAWKSGDPTLLIPVMDAFINNQESQRVNYTLRTVLDLNPSDKVAAAVKSVVNSSSHVEKEKEINSMMEFVESQKERKEENLKVMMDSKKDLKVRISTIRLVRNSTYHEYIPQFLQLIANQKEDLSVRLNMAEALGWFNCSYRRGEIITGCKAILADKATPAELKKELTQTILRVQ